MQFPIARDEVICCATLFNFIPAGISNRFNLTIDSIAVVILDQLVISWSKSPQKLGEQVLEILTNNSVPCYCQPRLLRAHFNRTFLKEMSPNMLQKGR